MATFKIKDRVIDVPSATMAEIASLESRTGRLALTMIAIGRWYGVPLVIRALGAKRTPGEQQRLVVGGQSKTVNSKHLLGRAFDLDVDRWARDALPREIWPWLGGIARQLSLTQPMPQWDPGHFES